MPQRPDRRTMDTETLIDKLHRERALSGEEWVRVIDGRTPQAAEHLFGLAREVRQAVYGKGCLHPGAHRVHQLLPERLLLLRHPKEQPARPAATGCTQDQILDCCRRGYELGFRTFVLQGGEDGWFTDERMVCLIPRASRPDFRTAR